MLSAQFIGEELNMSKQIEDLRLQTKVLFKVVDKLEQRIATLEKVIGKATMLRLGDVVLYIDKKEEQS